MTWKALASNMVKMKLNFFGFHTYPTSPKAGAIAEPLMWVGTSSGYNHSTGQVHADAAYDTSWYLTEDFWAEGTRRMRGNVGGQRSLPTSSYCCGASQAFERDCYGSAAQADSCYTSTDTNPNHNP